MHDGCTTFRPKGSSASVSAIRLCSSPPPMPRVSHDESSPKNRIRYSKGYWKDYHAAKAARAPGKLVAPPNWDASIYNPLSDLERIYTFVPGQRGLEHLCPAPPNR
ncbi:hypothetical protein FB45DRAFT_1030823 [Roridomyces roridus]|uniref:Uncharacterized protein n=1 Tax=Roridomyces roridus TaxID=1738132 RepID=A0AAD7BLX1_9AGAR|nr:hypothetical protein FB45DRAFT_1042125 [Roridomyces roridus]KAJ7624689.1 hypothetical protein FB45DRAFT_1030823 [Roridomyces roridus]